MTRTNSAGITFNYLVPGKGCCSSHYSVNYYYSPSENKVLLYINKQTGDPGESYNSFRIVQIVVNASVPGGRMALPNIDFSNYEAVRQYYNLPN
jgi:hypothetical protein